MKHLIVGVAGHVDHGKTTLVRALTGIYTDRLKEERERGMSIVLGFAHLELEPGTVDFIDVPGHERFIRTMISGAAGAGALMLAVDAKELIKPQTIEHLTLCRLLGVTRGLVIVTKCDLIEKHDRAGIAELLRSFLTGTFLADSPIVFASSFTGEGLGEVRDKLSRLLVETEPAENSPFFYMPVDRAFSIQGHGTVVTGTLRFGSLGVGGTVEVAPSGKQASVRRLESHSREIGCALPGTRTAVNLRGVSLQDFARGAAIATPGFLTPSRRFDVELMLLDGAVPIKPGSNVVVHFGSGEAAARVYPIGNMSISGAEAEYAQLRLASEQCIPVGERLILRLPSPPATIGGALVIDSDAPLHRSKGGADSTALFALLSALARGTVTEKLAARLAYAGVVGWSRERFRRDCRLAHVELSSLVAALDAVQIGDLLIERQVFAKLLDAVVDVVRSFHEAHRLKPGVPSDQLHRLLPDKVPVAVFSGAIDNLAKSGRVAITRGFVKLPDHNPLVNLSDIERRIRNEIAKQYLRDALSPPDAQSVVKSDRRKKMLLNMLIDDGTLILVSESAAGNPIIFHRASILKAQSNLETILTSGGLCTISEIGKALGITRKHSVPLLEYFDRLGVTRRQGDSRVLNFPTEVVN